MTAAISVASFNIHGGFDGWGRPFDVVDACRVLDADVLVIEENCTMIGEPSTAAQVALELGYSVVEETFTPVVLIRDFSERPDERRWGPPGLRPTVRAIHYPDEGSPPWRRMTRRERSLQTETVEIGLAMLVRLAHRATVVALPRLILDPSRRQAIVCELALDDGPIRVAGVHFGHLTHGSPRQMRAIARALRGGPPTVLVGDMNAWGPVVLGVMPRFHRGVRGSTWPAWRPHHQIDHLLVSRGIVVSDGTVGPALGSDHLPIRAVVGLDASTLRRPTFAQA